MHAQIREKNILFVDSWWKDICHFIFFFLVFALLGAISCDNTTLGIRSLVDLLCCDPQQAHLKRTLPDRLCSQLGPGRKTLPESSAFQGAKKIGLVIEYVPQVFNRNFCCAYQIKSRLSEFLRAHTLAPAVLDLYTDRVQSDRDLHLSCRRVREMKM